MNSCILMAQVISEPELRFTQDNKSVSNMMVEFEGTREGEPSAKLQVEGWGNLAEEMKNNYHPGDTIIIEGRLSMNLFEMPEGYKEKRARLVASRIYPIGGASLATNNSETGFESVSTVDSTVERALDREEADRQLAAKPAPKAPPAYSSYDDTETTTATASPAKNQSYGDLDEIPF